MKFEIHRELVEAVDRGERCALAVILQADGSTPQKAGVKALINESGRIRGTLGGGIVEGEAQRLGAEACRTGQAFIHDFDLTEAYAREAGPICGGAMRILIDPGIAKYRHSYAAATQALNERRRGVLVTRTIVEVSRLQPEFRLKAGHPNSRPAEVAVEWFAEGAASETMDFPGVAALRDCLKTEKPGFHGAGADETALPADAAFLEPVIPRPIVLIAGGGHVGQALARLAAFNEYEVAVIDDRAEFANPALFPENTRTRRGEISRELAGFPIDGDTHIAIVTRGHRQDAEALEACLHTPAASIGMIGSRRKVALMRKHFIDSGLTTAEAFDRVFAPIGLDIGAITVPEIATSIMAQIIAVRRKGEAAARRGGMARS